MTIDAKIQDIAVRYIRKAIGNRALLPFESLATLHPSLTNQVPLQDEELVLVSGFFSDESWYVFTTRRILSKFEGEVHSIDASDDIWGDFPNFKGYAPDDNSEFRKAAAVPRDIATITARSSHKLVRFEYQTFQGSTLPMYAAQYWNTKHPNLDRLMTSAELSEYRNRQC